MRTPTTTVTLLPGLLLVACGQVDGSGAADGGTVECGSSVFDAGALDEATPASALPAGPARAVDDLGDPAFDPSLGWSVVARTQVRVDLVRVLGEPVDNGAGDLRTHESITLERIEGSSNVADGTWLRTSSGPCTPRLVLAGGLEPADLVLAEEPAPTARTVELLVHERACASGQPADGRVDVEVDETTDQIRLRVGVRPLRGGQNCQGNPGTPVTVRLDGPVGERMVVDTAVLPPRAVTVVPGDRGTPAGPVGPTGR